MGLFADKEALGQVSSDYFLFPLRSTFHPNVSSTIRGWYKCALAYVVLRYFKMNSVLWDVTLYGSSEKRRFSGK
jgi:hypothetical protein